MHTGDLHIADKNFRRGSDKIGLRLEPLKSVGGSEPERAAFVPESRVDEISR